MLTKSFLRHRLRGFAIVHFSGHFCPRAPSGRDSNFERDLGETSPLEAYFSSRSIKTKLYHQEIAQESHFPFHWFISAQRETEVTRILCFLLLNNSYNLNLKTVSGHLGVFGVALLLLLGFLTDHLLLHNVANLLNAALRPG